MLVLGCSGGDPNPMACMSVVIWCMSMFDVGGSGFADCDMDELGSPPPLYACDGWCMRLYSSASFGGSGGFCCGGGCCGGTGIDRLSDDRAPRERCDNEFELMDEAGLAGRSNVGLSGDATRPSEVHGRGADRADCPGGVGNGRAGGRGLIDMAVGSNMADDDDEDGEG